MYTNCGNSRVQRKKNEPLKLHIIHKRVWWGNDADGMDVKSVCFFFPPVAIPFRSVSSENTRICVYVKNIA